MSQRTDEQVLVKAFKPSLAARMAVKWDSPRPWRLEYKNRKRRIAYVRAYEATPLSDVEMYHFLKNRLLFVDLARKRARWWGGRLLNTLAGENPEWLQISGRYASQILEVIGQESDVCLSATQQYWLRVSAARRAYQVLNTANGEALGKRS